MAQRINNVGRKHTISASVAMGLTAAASALQLHLKSNGYREVCGLILSGLRAYQETMRATGTGNWLHGEACTAHRSHAPENCPMRILAVQKTVTYTFAMPEVAGEEPVLVAVTLLGSMDANKAFEWTTVAEAVIQGSTYVFDAEGRARLYQSGGKG